MLLKTVILYRVYHLLPLRELKRRARGYHDAKAMAIYKVASNGRTLDTLLYIFGLATASYILIVATDYKWWAGVLSVLLIAWLIFMAPRPRYGGFIWRFCAATSAYVFKFLSWVRPVVDLLARWLPAPHDGVHRAYELEDLLELLDDQAKLPDNRIPERDLAIAASALSFSDKPVSKVMLPRKKMHFISESDVVGPMLIDELHKFGRLSYPVVKGSAKAGSPEITGVLFLNDIVEVGQENKGSVKDRMKKGIYYINEACDLNQALDAVLKKQHHQLLVINKFEELVGVITFEDLLRELVGERLSEEFEAYENIHSVAELDAHKKHNAEPEQSKTEESAEQTPEEPVATEA